MSDFTIKVLGPSNKIVLLRIMKDEGEARDAYDIYMDRVSEHHKLCLFNNRSGEVLACSNNWEKDHD